VIAVAGAFGSRGVVRALASLALATLVTAGSPGFACAADAREGQGAANASPAPVRTAKERLSGKAADEQRVDNCKVPVELRGPKPRPDACGAGRTRER
jgi:hypothetical protein